MKKNSKFKNLTFWIQKRFFTKLFSERSCSIVFFKTMKLRNFSQNKRRKRTWYRTMRDVAGLWPKRKFMLLLGYIEDRK
jgi:hypothetical protein